MLETVFASAQAVVARDKTTWENALLLSPGVRWAYNFKNGLQIVPGVAMPVGVGPSGGEKGFFLYLSLSIRSRGWTSEARMDRRPEVTSEPYEDRFRLQHNPPRFLNAPQNLFF